MIACTGGTFGALKLRGFSKSTIDVYARAVRRVAAHYDCCPDQLTVEQLEIYFAKLVDTHAWSTVKVDRNGLKFFWQQVLKKDWTWINIIRAPKVKTLPDILTVSEIEQLIGATRYLLELEARYADQLLPGHYRIISAIQRCRTTDAGEILWQ